MAYYSPSWKVPEFKDQMRAARLDLGMSQGNLAKLTGMNPSALSHFECGRRLPSIRNLKRLCNALKVSADYLIGR